MAPRILAEVQVWGRLYRAKAQPEAGVDARVDTGEDSVLVRL